MKKYIKKSFFIKFIWVLLLCINSTYGQGGTQTYTSKAALKGNLYTVNDMLLFDYGVLYHLNYDQEEGIQGTMATSGDRIDVYVYDFNTTNSEGVKGREIYHVYIDDTTSPGVYQKKYLQEAPIQLDGDYGFITQSNDIKKRAQDARVYSPGQCNNTWTDLFKSALIPFSCIGGYARPVQPVVVEVKITGNAKFIKAKIPGLGVVSVSNGEVILSPPGDFYNYCNSNVNSPLCQLFNNIRYPDMHASEDIFIASHRGWWGYDLGSGVPENTLAAVQEANNLNVKIVEMDITASADNELVFMHDYVMKRLTDYTGDKFSFNLTWSTMKDYKVRRRDGTVSNHTLSRFFEVLKYVKNNNMILMVDIKEQQSNGKAPNCLANCDFQDIAKQKESWTKIARQCIRQAESIEGKKNLIIKTYYPPEEIYKLIGNQMFTILWTPMIVPNNFKNASGNPDINLMTDFVNKWGTDSKYKNTVACFETNFFSPTDVMLQRFTLNATTYQNLLHYIHAKTGRRSGIFSEEPVNPKGTVNRWGKWKIKDPSKDIRGDFLRLMDIPFGNRMLITTDRYDVWEDIKQKF